MGTATKTQSTFSRLRRRLKYLKNSVAISGNDCQFLAKADDRSGAATRLIRLVTLMKYN